MGTLSNDVCERLRAVEQAQAAQLVTLEKLNENTKEIIQLFQTFKGAFGLLELAAKLVRPMGYIAMGVMAIIGAIATIKGAFF